MDIFLVCCIFSTLLFVFVKVRFFLKILNKSRYILKVYKTTENAKKAGYEFATKELMGNFWKMILSFSFTCLIWILYLSIN